jgi:hypothetical protein
MAASSSAKIEPSEDPFSPHFKGPFQGIPTRTLPEDTIAFSLYLLPSSTTSPENFTAQLQYLLTSTLELARNWSAGYIWQREPFTLSIATATTTSSSALPSHLEGTLEYGDAIDDEWFCVAILMETSRRNPEVWIRVRDSDGEFLLIEAAHALPRWLKPEIAENRVWIKGGRVYVIPLSAARGGGRKEIGMEEAVEVLRGCRDPASLWRDKDVEREALVRARGYPEAAGRGLHRSLVAVPRKLAAMLRAFPESVAAAVEAFYARDPVALRVLGKSRGRVLEWGDTVVVSVRFTKVLFAQLKGQVWEPPKAAGFPVAREGDGRVDVGVKLTAGFEMLLARENDVLLTSPARRKMVEELRDWLEKGVELPGDEEVESWERREDGEAWLEIDFTEFEKDLGGSQTENPFSRGAEAYGDPGQEEKLKRMVERFEQFLNDDTAGIDGAEFSDESDEDDEDDESDEDGEDKAVSFDEEEFSRMMREMMGLPPDGVEDSDPRQVQAEQEDEEEDEREIKRIQDQIEKELTEAGAIEREKPKITEIKGEDEEGEEEEGEVNIDYTLAKNLLESFKGQGGLAGPAGNLLARMGVILPRDEPDAEDGAGRIEGKGKGKGKEVTR